MSSNLSRVVDRELARRFTIITIGQDDDRQLLVTCQ